MTDLIPSGRSVPVLPRSYHYELALTLQRDRRGIMLTTACERYASP
jgi:hypothetical protein